MNTLIIGAGGHGKVVLDILRAGRKYKPVGWLDADVALHGTTVAGLEVLGGINLLPKLWQRKIKHVIVAIGDNRVRMSYARSVTEAGLELANAVHPSAVMSRSAVVGRNVVVAAGAIVSAEATLADSVIVNTAAVVDHECIVGEAVHLSPTVALAGRVRVGACAFVGIGAKVLPCLSIGDNATVGAGAVVLFDVPAGATVVGMPARVIKQV